MYINIISSKNFWFWDGYCGFIIILHVYMHRMWLQYTVHTGYMIWVSWHTCTCTFSLLTSLPPCFALTPFVSVFQTSVFVVTDTQRVGEHIQHVGYVEKGEIRKGDKLTARINQVNHLVHTWLDVLYIILWNHQKICCDQFSWSINFQFPQNVFLWIYLHDKWIGTNCVL